MTQPLSTTVDGMQKGSQEMLDAWRTITGYINGINDDVHTMKYTGGAADRFRGAINDWSTEASSIARELDTFATNMQANAANIAKTENTNVGTANF
jgi:uncharacterized protein YukE